jgi:hypothetical protein
MHLPRVESRKGAVAAFGSSVSLPAHQTGRAGFPHPAFRLASSRGTRQRSQVNAPEVEHPERAKHRFARKAVGAVRGHLVTSNQEATDPLVDVIVDPRPLCTRPLNANASDVAVLDPVVQHGFQAY